LKVGLFTPLNRLTSGISRLLLPLAVCPLAALAVPAQEREPLEVYLRPLTWGLTKVRACIA
jgi:hypothetical protein